MIQGQEQKQEQELDTCNTGCSSGTTGSNNSNTETGATEATNQTDADFVEDKDIIPSTSPTRIRTAVPSISPVTQTNKEGGGVISNSQTLQPSSSGTFSTSYVVSHPPSSDGAMKLVEVSFGSIFISVSLPARISSRRRIRRALASSVKDLKDRSSSSTVAIGNKLLTQQRATLVSAEVDALQTTALTVCIDAFSQKYGSDFNSCDVTLHRSTTIVDDNLIQNEQQQSGEDLLVLYIITGSVWFQIIQQPQDRQQEQEQHTSLLSPPTQREVTRYLAMTILESKAFLTLLVETSNKTMPSSLQSTANITIATANATNTNSSNFHTIVLNSTVTINVYHHFDGEEGESVTFIDDDYDIDDDSRNGANITATPSPSSSTNSPGTAAAGERETPPSKRRSRTSQKRKRVAIMISIIFILLLLLALMIHVKYKLCFHIVFGRCLGYCPCRGSCCCFCCCYSKKKHSPSSYSSTSSPPAPPSYSCDLPSSGRRIIFGAGNITSTHRHRPSMTPSPISFVYLDDDDGDSSPASSTTNATIPNVTITNTTDKNHQSPSCYNNNNTSSRRSRYYKNNNDDESDDDDSSNNHSLHLWSKWNDIRYKKRRTTNYYKRNQQHHGATTHRNRSNSRSKRDTGTPSSNTTTSSKNVQETAGASSSITSITTTNSPLKNIKFQNVFDLEQAEDHGSSRDFDQVWEGSIV